MNAPPALDVARSDPRLVADAGDSPRPEAPARRHGAAIFVGVVAAATLLALGAWLLHRPLSGPPASERARVADAASARGDSPPGAATPSPDAARYPLPAVPAGVGLPPLAGSDGAFGEAVEAVLGRAAFARWLVPQDLIRRIVATVDNLPRRSLPARVRAVPPVPGTLEVARAGTATVVAEANAARYEPLVHLLETLDAQRLLYVYVDWYPRFQDAYRELGYPQGHFNDRLVEAIDTMLATPVLREPPAVIQPKVLWAFADPDLEALPAGQKLMLRMGPANAERVKARLLAVRRLVTQAVPR